MITVYSRPGCPFCYSLRGGLRRAGIGFQEVDIWEDPKAAAFVRSVNGGSETVPTVTVDSMILINPSARQVLAASSCATDSGA
ncbi:MAG: NrdH-redoxin [Actinobacteria bacterium]|nr:NrdH-redoxin [Actinomycetota bacterium]